MKVEIKIPFEICVKRRKALRWLYFRAIKKRPAAEKYQITANKKRLPRTVVSILGLNPQPWVTKTVTLATSSLNRWFLGLKKCNLKMLTVFFSPYMSNEIIKQNLTLVGSSWAFSIPWSRSGCETCSTFMEAHNSYQIWINNGVIIFTSLETNKLVWIYWIYICQSQHLLNKLKQDHLMNEAPPRLQYLRTNLTDSVSSKSDRNLWRPKSVKGKKREYGQIQVRWHKKKRLKLLELSPVAMFEFLNMILKPLSQTLNKSDKWWSQTLMVLYFDGKEWLGMQ